MAKRAKARWSEAELIDTFGLDKMHLSAPLLVEWLDASVALNEMERMTFSRILREAVENIEGWNEEDLKMNCVGSPIYCFCNRFG